MWSPNTKVTPWPLCDLPVGLVLEKNLCLLKAYMVFQYVTISVKIHLFRTTSIILNISALSALSKEWFTKVSAFCGE